MRVRWIVGVGALVLVLVAAPVGTSAGGLLNGLLLIRVFGPLTFDGAK